jgi:GntR family transcriptional regulator
MTVVKTLPIYYQIAQTIRQWIVQQEYEPGDKIPSENEIAALYGVSRLTARQALSQLVEERLLVRKRGQGTFVTDNASVIRGISLAFTGFLDDLFYEVSRAETKWASISQIKAPKRVSEKLKVPQNDTIIQIKRARFLENKPFCFALNYLPFEIGSKIKEDELYKKPLLQIMEQDLGINFSEALQIIESTFAEQEVAEHIQTIPGAPILFVERIMYGQKKKPIEMVQLSYRGDTFKYIVKLTKIQRKNKGVWVHGAG